MRIRPAFTAVEAMVVVVVLGILAAVVIPQFCEATQDSRLSGLISDLQNVRTELHLYQIHHRGTYPALAAFTEQLTRASKSDGRTAAPGTTGFPFGPYLKTIPFNPYTATNDVTELPAGPHRAWYYDERTGKFRTNDGVHDYL